MERPKRPYSLNKRPTTKKNKYIYYVRFRHPETGEYMSAVSSGETNKASAANWADDQLKKGLVLLPGKKNITFSRYAGQFWDYDKSPYIKAKLARGGSISHGYATTSAAWVTKYLIPTFGERRLYSITRREIETWQLTLYEAGTLAPVTINKVFSVLRIMMREALHEGIIPSEPTEGIRELAEKPTVRGILTIKEIKKLFAPKALIGIWEGNLPYYTMNMLALTTGMRQGEIRGLLWEHVHEDYIDIVHSWENSHGLKGAKCNSERDVPIPERVHQCLSQLHAQCKNKESGHLVFSGESENRPYNKKAFTGSLYRALKNIGVSEEQRIKRNITFHSLRHTFMSIFRGQIPDEKLRKFSGHRTQAMVEHYTHSMQEDLYILREKQQKILA